MDLKTQQAFLAKSPLNPGKKIELEDLLDFVLFDANDEAHLSKSLYIKKFKQRFEIWEDNQQIFKFKDKIELDWLTNEVFGFSRSQ